MPSPDILVIEDGSIVADANSYVTYDYVDEYHELRGNSAWAAGSVLDKQYAIIRATQAIDSMYKEKWLGQQTEYGTQELEWPRQDVEVNGIELDDDLIPKNLKKAVADAALKELLSPNSLMPDLERGGEIKRVKADTVEVEYMQGANSSTVYTAFDGLLADLISGSSSSGVGAYDVSLGG